MISQTRNHGNLIFRFLDGSPNPQTGVHIYGSASPEN
jgi:hypothetical protein